MSASFSVCSDFVLVLCKQGKPLMPSKPAFIKEEMARIAKILDFSINIMETDLDHLHFLIDSSPSMKAVPEQVC